MATEQLKRVKYEGPARRVSVDLPDGSTVFCDRDKSIKVPASIAKGLLAQDVWSKGDGVKGEDAPEVPDPEEKN